MTDYFCIEQTGVREKRVIQVRANDEIGEDEELIGEINDGKITTSDEQARQMMKKFQKSQYNVQMTVDIKRNGEIWVRGV